MNLPKAAGGPTPGKKLTIAIEGCCHGELDNIYGTLQHLEQKEGKKIDLLISCGDFQAVRNLDDLETMSCPVKYRALNTFYKYYSGEAKAPYPTLFIGGNHEAANYMWELYYGGWAAPNIYFMGYTGCVKFGGVRIAGLSGTYSQAAYMRGHDEKLPYSESSIRSMYHIRDFEVYRLMQIKQPVDIFLSHDWPTNIANYGNKEQLLSRKQFLRSEIEDGSLGNPAGQQLMSALQPRYWFSAHMHTKFPAIVPHSDSSITRFLALDKCLPGRDFLQVAVIPLISSSVFQHIFWTISYDEEWLAIMRSTHDVINLDRRHQPLPGMGALRKGASEADVKVVEEVLQQRGGAKIDPTAFVQTARPADASAAAASNSGSHTGFRGPKKRGRMPSAHVRNPQTESLLQMLQLPYNLEHGPRQMVNMMTGSVSCVVDNHAALPPPPARTVTEDQVNAALDNPEEIDLGGEEEDQVEEEEESGQQQAGQDNTRVEEEQHKEADVVKPTVSLDGTTLEDDPMFKPMC
ncbi:hypothetical protein CEUSTIGMA_g5529.t1 [Chlamydomonas eustigma]|uniref:Lariat debranching enzyme C-terminal domain-containing protein n=1 Tax=Chlamydomonas eustigma TaxID=1157962 RepID=A0A250X4S1_9CHLO|nr:hypothetical protein CEUSTIGMA_g5529.t1 [Chlamydomonas eustigma]|eukprot:GAX78087.1 hypothetical protein CEUSTIGMA_g5529.t1 [Chlamydomonas eustigma]